MHRVRRFFDDIVRRKGRAPGESARKVLKGWGMTERMKVLVIDDDMAVARALQRRLAGHEVVLAADGASAVALVETAMMGDGKPFDVVLCDQHMPDIRGNEVLARMRSLPFVPVLVLMSGLHDLGESATAADGVLVKPFRPSDLFELVTGVKLRKMRATTQRIRCCAAL